MHLTAGQSRLPYVSCSTTTSMLSTRPSLSASSTAPRTRKVPRWSPSCMTSPPTTSRMRRWGLCIYVISFYWSCSSYDQGKIVVKSVMLLFETMFCNQYQEDVWYILLYKLWLVASNEYFRCVVWWISCNYSDGIPTCQYLSRHERNIGRTDIF